MLLILIWTLLSSLLGLKNSGGRHRASGEVLGGCRLVAFSKPPHFDMFVAQISVISNGLEYTNTGKSRENDFKTGNQVEFKQQPHASLGDMAKVAANTNTTEHRLSKRFVLRETGRACAA